MSRKISRPTVFLPIITRVKGFPIFSDTAPSEEFNTALCRSSSVGSCYINCEFCGREHFSSEYSGDDEPSDQPANESNETPLETLHKKAEQQPNGQYIFHPEASVCWCYLDNRQYVVDCPCNAGLFYEKIFWQHLAIISIYSKARANAQLDKARRKVELAESIVVPT